jgi:3-hydroxybutyryl-CoA dehydrogenase
LRALETNDIVGVVGAGTMGAGIAQVAAAAGHTVHLFDASEGAADAGKARIATGVQGLVSKGRLAHEDAAALLDRI